MSSSLGNTQLLVGRAGGYSSNYTADISGSLYCASGCVLAASGGYVGIGTTTPAYTLDVSGTGRYIGNIYMPGYPSILCADYGTTTINSLAIPNYGLSWQTDTAFNSNGPTGFLSSWGGLKFQSGAVTRMSINGVGNVGIGTSSINGKLHIYEGTGTGDAGTTSGSLVIEHGNNGGVSSIIFPSKNNYNSDYGYIRYRDDVNNGTGGAEQGRLEIGTNDDIGAAGGVVDALILQKGGGYVGIGVVNPGCALSFPNNETNKVISLYDLGPTDAAATASNFYGFGVNSAVLRYQVPSGNTHRFYIGTTNSVTINSSGYVGIGTTNPAYQLDVNGMINCNNLLRVTSGTNNTSYQYDRIQFQSGGSGPFYVLNSNSTGVRLDNGTTSWTTQSDGRLKNIIEPITDAISKIDKLNPVIYSWISDDSNTRQVGLLAQDVLKVQPESVSVDPNDGYLGVRYTELIPLAFAGIKEQKVIIQTQQNQIQELQTENNDLKSRLAAIESRLTAAGF